MREREKNSIKTGKLETRIALHLILHPTLTAIINDSAVLTDINLDAIRSCLDVRVSYSKIIYSV